MEKQFVVAGVEVHCKWEGLPPRYRIFINNELFVERTFKFMNEYVEEVLQISADPGMYVLNLVPILPTLAEFRLTAHNIKVGNARWIKGNKLEILS